MSWLFSGKQPTPKFIEENKDAFVNFSRFLTKNPELTNDQSLNIFLGENNITVYRSEKHLYEYSQLEKYELIKLGSLLNYNSNPSGQHHGDGESTRGTITVQPSTGDEYVMDVYNDAHSGIETTTDMIFIFKDSLPSNYKDKNYKDKNYNGGRSRKIQRKRRRTKRRVRRTKKQ